MISSSDLAQTTIPIVTFILGWGSGVITTALMLRDHERRLSHFEKWVDSHEIWAGEKATELENLKTTLKVKGLLNERKQ